MSIKTNRLDVFLRLMDSSKHAGGVVWMSYDLNRGDGSINSERTSSVGPFSEDDMTLAVRILRNLREESFSRETPPSPIVFHNGSKNSDSIPTGYNGTNDEVLIHRLPQERYKTIGRALDSLYPSLPYRPQILLRLSEMKG